MLLNDLPPKRQNKIKTPPKTILVILRFLAKKEDGRKDVSHD